MSRSYLTLLLDTSMSHSGEEASVCCVGCLAMRCRLVQPRWISRCGESCDLSLGCAGDISQHSARHPARHLLLLLALGETTVAWWWALGCYELEVYPST